MKYEDYKSEIELSINQTGEELDLNSVIAYLVRFISYKRYYKISMREVTEKRSSNMTRGFKSRSGYPDFVFLKPKNYATTVLGAVEVMSTDSLIDTNNARVDGHIKSFKKVIYTNGLDWIFYNGNEDYSIISLGSNNRGKIKWNKKSEWNLLIDKISDFIRRL